MKNLPIYCILILFIALLIAGIIEKRLHRKRLSRIPVRILVNGTRGKTSVTRLLAAALRESGLRTWAKTTGTQAAWILPDGNECEYRKNRPVSIREQIPFVRKACRDGAQAIVVECMALHPEYQHTMAEELVRPDIVVITNARVDHISEIGATEAETAETLALSVPRDARLVCDDPELDRYTENRISAAEVCIERDYLDSFEYPMFEDNVRQVIKVCELLSIPREIALRGMLNARPDAGMLGPFRCGGNLIINGFAANDRDSALLLYKDTGSRFGMQSVPLRILFNNRNDREFRIREFVPLIRELPCTEIAVCGDNAVKAARFFAGKCDVPAAAVQDALVYADSPSNENCVILCLGNIKGEGMRFVTALQERKVNG